MVNCCFDVLTFSIINKRRLFQINDSLCTYSCNKKEDDDEEEDLIFNMYDLF